MNAEKFIDSLEQKGLLDKNIVSKLRRQLDKVKDSRKVTAEKIARLLVENGHLTKFQATKLVAEFMAPKEEAATAAPDGRAPSLKSLPRTISRS